MDKPHWSLPRNQGESPPQPARELPAAFRRTLGRSPRHLPRQIQGDPSRSADRAAGTRRTAAGALGRGHLHGGRQQQDRGLAAARGGRVGLVGAVSARLSEPEMPPRTSRTPRRSCSPWHQAASAPARRCGLSGTPVSTSNAARNSGCVPCCWAVKCRRRSWSGRKPHLVLRRLLGSVSLYPGLVNHRIASHLLSRKHDSFVRVLARLAMSWSVRLQEVLGEYP